jgi:predicted phage-related endonuclease
MSTQVITQIAPPIPTREDWLEQRRRYVGGSDSASLFPEDSKYGCSTRLFFDKSGQKPDYPRTQREEDILKRGNVWESIVANYFSETTGSERCGAGRCGFRKSIP